MEPPLHFGEEKMRKERKKRGKKKSAPSLRISGFATGYHDNRLLLLVDHIFTQNPKVNAKIQ